jgi:hypothetical protein
MILIEHAIMAAQILRELKYNMHFFRQRQLGWATFQAGQQLGFEGAPVECDYKCPTDRCQLQYRFEYLSRTETAAIKY